MIDGRCVGTGTFIPEGAFEEEEEEGEVGEVKSEDSKDRFIPHSQHLSSRSEFDDEHMVHFQGMEEEDEESGSDFLIGLES